MPFAFKARLSAIAAVLLLAALITGPAHASPKQTNLPRSLSDIVKHHDNLCDAIQAQVFAAQVIAEEFAGTIKGLSAEAAADNLFQKGADSGCAWAS